METEEKNKGVINFDYGEDDFRIQEKDKMDLKLLWDKNVLYRERNNILLELVKVLHNKLGK